MLRKVIDISEKIVLPLNFVSGKLASIILFFMMILTAGDVLGRFLVRPITGTHELTYLSLAIMVFISLGFTQQAKGHISVGVLVDKFPPRIQSIVDIVSYTFMVIILVLMGLETYKFGLRKMNNVTGDLELPISIFIFISVLGIIIFTLTVLLDLLKSIQKVVSNDES